VSLQHQCFSLRYASRDDAHWLHEFVNNAYRGESSKKGWTTEAELLGGQRTSPKNLREQLNDTRQKILLLFDMQKCLACVNLVEESAESLYFGMLTVDPELQSQGLGKFMMQEVFRLASTQRFKVIRLHVISERKELIEWYKRRGFNLTGKKEPFPMHDPEFGIPKVDFLEFLEMQKTL
jgi:ribosomal protein S18 acetylase RimI-like enzyme